MIILGRHSYHGRVISTYNPTIYVGHFTSIGDNVEFYGKAHHQNVKYKECVTTFPFRNHLNWKVNSFFESGVSRREDGTIKIGSDVWIGDNALIMDGVTIGEGAIIGTRAVVTKDVPSYAVVTGNPGVIRKMRFTEQQIELLLKIRWWNWPDDIIKSRTEDLKDINIFIKKYL